MKIRMIHIGYGSYVSGQRVVSVLNPESAPVKRMIQEAKEERRLVDATFGKKTRSVMITDSDHLILSALTTEEICHLFHTEDDGQAEEDEDA